LAERNPPGLVDVAPARAGERQRPDGAGAANAWERPHRLLETDEEAVGAERPLVAGAGERYGEGEQPVRVEADGDRVELQEAQSQYTTSQQQHEAQPDLRGHERRPRPAPIGPEDRARRVEISRQVAPRDRERRQEAEENGGPEAGGGREREDGAVERDPVRARELSGPEGPQDVEAGLAEKDPERAPREGHDERLREEQADD